MAVAINKERNISDNSEDNGIKEKKIRKNRKILMKKKSVSSETNNTETGVEKGTKTEKITKENVESNDEFNNEQNKDNNAKKSKSDDKGKKDSNKKSNGNGKDYKYDEKNSGEEEEIIDNTDVKNKNGKKEDNSISNVESEKDKNEDTNLFKKENNNVELKTKNEELYKNEDSKDEDSTNNVNKKNENNHNIYNFESANEIGTFEDSNGHTSKYRLLKERFELEEILKLSYPQLIDLANEMGLDVDFKMNKQDLIFKILKLHTDLGGTIYANGVLDTISDKEKNKSFGFLRYPSYNYFASSEDIYVSGSQISLFGMKKGDTVSGFIRSPIGKENYFALIKVDKVNGRKPEECKKRVSFENLIPIYPNEKLKLEYRPDKYATRLLDLFAPIGKGQRALIVAPPKAGKTMILQEIANAININHPEAHVIILLIDERPEEVTDMKENVPNAEVIASTFDEQPTRHVKIAELVIEKAKRLVEHREDVIILLDSITRLARAYNLTVQTSGKVLSGGVDANALYGPKKFFGAARNIRDGGSLTIIATALVDTGSKMDEVIFEEFKGTGNMEVNLSRELAERRIFPAIDLVKSSTRKEELLLDNTVKDKIWAIRSVLSDMGEIEATTKVLERMKKTKNNNEFLNAQHLQEG